MRIQANPSDPRNNPGLQLYREQNNTALQPSRKFVNTKDTTTVSSSSPQSDLLKTHRVPSYSSYSFQNAGPYHQAIRAYQQSARFESDLSVPLASVGDRMGEEVRSNETALTDLLREEPGNSAAWYDLGLLYYQQGSRDLVSAVYQVLQRVDSLKAEDFSTQLRLDEKMLLEIV